MVIVINLIANTNLCIKQDIYKKKKPTILILGFWLHSSTEPFSESWFY